MLSRDPLRTIDLQQAFLERFISFPFNDEASEIHGQIRGYLKTAGTPIGPYDSLIAATALAHDLTLVTHNVREFSRVQGLRIEDWEATDSY
jgi:tRNA(fMet)-specific endonuclease VapC